MSLLYLLLFVYMVSAMGSQQVSPKRILMSLDIEDLRLLRAALRGAKMSPDRPLTFHQDIAASSLVSRISLELRDVDAQQALTEK